MNSRVELAVGEVGRENVGENFGDLKTLPRLLTEWFRWINRHNFFMSILYCIFLV